jgi:RNA polymerase sigma factor (sigma-70 family)
MRREQGSVRRVEDRLAAAGFESFFREQFTVAVRIANAVVGDTHVAEDVAQEAFMATRRRFPDPERAQGAAPWLHAAAAHLALNEVRGRRRREGRMHHDIGPSRLEGPEEVAIAKEAAEGVRGALRRLPRHAATVLVLRHSGLAYVEIAEAMGVKVNHVGTMLRRAERALRKEVERDPRE